MMFSSVVAFSLWGILFLCATTTVAFSPIPCASGLRCGVKYSGITTLRISTTETDKLEVAVTNPSTAFGAPVSEDMQRFNQATVGVIKNIVFDTLFAGKDRAYARFWALENIARVPYFSYLSVLHLYETLGIWRKAKYLKIHFAESWNELHHLLIMEELGGADRWVDRFVAQHISVTYFVLVCMLYVYNPTVAYNINQNVEEHAFAVYDKFLKENGEELKKLPAPKVAIEYYGGEDLYMFDEFQTGTCEPRRPVINNLYDVFVQIKLDEAQHVKTMAHLQTDLELTNPHDDSEECEVPYPLPTEL